MLMTLSKLKSEPGELAGEVQPARKIRLGWFSSWNTRCGIAEYSKYLLGEIDAKRFEWTVLASYTEENIRDDAANVIRCWTNNVGSANALLAVVLKERFDVLVIQFNFGFLSLHHLEALIACCHCVGTRVVMIFHATVYVDPAGNAVSLPHSLATVDRLLVHSQADLERLQTFGLKDNVELFPHGYVDYGFFDRMACRQLLQLPPDDLIIGSYGFLLPHKGIEKLIETLALLRAAGKRAKLLLANALYPVRESEQHLSFCRRLAQDQGVADDVIFETRFLHREVGVRMLAACDVIIYPYQSSAESVSGAVRFGIASRRPVMCSPLPIFSDVSTVVHFLRGFRPQDICEDLQRFLSDEAGRERLSQRQAEWVERHSWSRMAKLLEEKLDKTISVQRQPESPAWIGHYIADLLANEETAKAQIKAQIETAKAQIAAAENTARAQIAAAENNARAQIAVAQNEAKARLAQAESSARARIAELEQSRLHWQNTAESTALQVQGIYASTSWRMTKPLRYLSERARALRAMLATLLHR
jgi:glycosyltransferase involved in cell wall biosynthesis